MICMLLLLVASASALPHGLVRSVSYPGEHVSVVRSVHQPAPLTVAREHVVQPAPLVQEQVHTPIQRNEHFADVTRVVGQTTNIIKPNLGLGYRGASVYNVGAPLTPSHTVVTNHQQIVERPVQTTVVEQVAPAAAYVNTAAVVDHGPTVVEAARTYGTYGVAAGVPLLHARSNLGYGAYATNLGYLGGPGYAYNLGY